MTKREEQKAQRRADILSVSLDLFVKRGYGSTKVTDIVNEAHISMGLLFHYFGTKEQLYHELILLGQKSTEFNFDYQCSPIEFFSRSANGILTLISKDTFAAKMLVFMTQALHNDGIPAQSKELLNQIDVIERSIPIVKQGQAIGEIRSGEPKALSVAFWGAIQGIAQQMVLRPDYPCPDSEWVTDILREPSNEGTKQC